MSAASQKGNLANFSFGFRRRGAHYLYLIVGFSTHPDAAAWEDEAGLLLQWNSDADGCLTGWGGVRGDAGFLSCGCRSEVV
ncbi:uncharacterized protein L3040_007990 [Drepanopeziza brunnea f. sp. 'multigermtubi']|uniref:uncharacterized protein n=1 Tax=Drepanopeziza brunnea f. sp. 'multigermtubi' TaxID=698441 RepID=UPI0023898232|nr:hypothetical protein L3040_007990 [Drepanopeziza brunnea f. sp. 'multigermtubi']